MNLLVISLVMLGLTETHAVHIPQQEEAQHEAHQDLHHEAHLEEAHPPKSEMKVALANTLHHSLMFGAELFSNLLSQKSERIPLRNRLDNIEKSILHLAYNLTKDAYQIYVEVQEEVKEKFPVFRENMIPVINKFNYEIIDIMYTWRDEMEPYYEQVWDNITNIEIHFFQQVKSIFLKHKDNWLAVLNINSLISRLKTFQSDIHQELGVTKQQEHQQEHESQEVNEKDVIEEILEYGEILMKLFDEETEIKSVFKELQEHKHKQRNN